MFCGRDCLRVNIQRRSQRGMPQQLLHHFEFRAHASQESRICVSECMPSELFLNPDALRHGADMLAQNCLAPDWFPTTVPSARENPVVEFGVPGAFFPFRERLQNCWMNRYGLLRCFSLARTHHSVHDGARDVHCALSKVDVSPLQSEQLALSQPR